MQTIRFSGRTPSPSSIEIGMETDSNSETLRFLLPQIDDGQIATLQMILPDGTADVLQINDGQAVIPARIMEIPGTARAWVEILGTGTLAWHSEMIYMGIVDTPDISERTEQQYPTALQEAVSRSETAQATAEAAAAYAAASSGQATFALNSAGHLVVTWTDTDGQSHDTDIGEVSAYAVAVKNGYTGTEAQWEQYIATASINAASAAADALKAEGYAVGKQAGTDVSSGSEYYHNNAKYYNTQAQSAKTAAQEAASTAAAAYGTDLLAADYDTETGATAGKYYIHSGDLYLCKEDVTGAWDGTKFEQVDVGGQMSDLKTNLNNSTGTEILSFAMGYILTNVGDGNEVNLTVHSSQAYGYAILTCQSGDTFVLNGRGTTDQRLWAFLDSQNKLNRKSNANVLADNLIITAEEGDVKLVINTVASYAGLCCKNRSVPVRLNALESEIGNTALPTTAQTITGAIAEHETDITALGQAITGFYGEIDKLKTGLNESTNTEVISLNYGGFISDNVAEGEQVNITVTSNVTQCYAIVTCQAGDTFTINGKGTTPGRLWAFLTADNIMRRKSNANVKGNNLIITAEGDETKLIINSIVDNIGLCCKNRSVPLRLNALESEAAETSSLANSTEAKLEREIQSQTFGELFVAQRYIAQDWHFGFIDVSQSLGFGDHHRIPGTAKIWNPNGTTDLTQNEVWMSDGVHPFKGIGCTDMYARTIFEQIKMIPPSYKDGVGLTSPTIWAGRKILWLGTSIPAGSDPDAGQGTGATYPALVGTMLDATVTNNARGKSCVRINASTGEYTGMMYFHFVRALTRTIDECDVIASNWDSLYDTLYSNIANAPQELSAAAVETMKAHSFETLLLPYLDGTYDMPDLFVLDHGHNDVRPDGIDGKSDLWINPSAEMIQSGILAPDTYMTDNNYANLKTALGNDLSGIPNLSTFAAKLNRNCFKGAMNFLITLILRYNPYARIIIVSDYVY
ncbi:MAG: hypothetical protein IKH57_21225 [Clostridia bacterium]|nr:hypothetical protein [Clostridia bacterium]